MRRGLLIFAIVCAAHAQPAFEVASVKLTAHGRDASGLSISDVRVAGPGRVQAINASLRECLQWAYELRDDQISGPAWLNDDNASYDIEAKAPPSTDLPELRRMFQTLLNERFRLQLRRETKVQPVYDLVVAKDAPRLPAATSRFSPGEVRSGGGEIHAASVTAKRLARSLRDEVHRLVFDKTGIETRFSVDLVFAPEGDSNSSRPSIFTALEQTLGLKLVATKAPIDYLVVERAQRIPTEN